jgi:putative sigma-54 modulation protein
MASSIADQGNGAAVWRLAQGADSVQISISTRHGHVSEETQAKITEKLEKLTRLYDRIGAIELTINLEHREAPAVDLKVSATHKHDFVAASTSVELLASVDDVVEKMEQQLRKYKQKVQDRHRGSGHRPPESSSEPEPRNL